MPPLMSQIADRMETRLQTVTLLNGYTWAVTKVQRRSYRDERPRPGGTAEIGIDPEGFVQDDDLNDSLGIKVQRTITWEIDFWMEISDDDDRPLDDLRSEALADIESALDKDICPGDGRPFNGLVYNARLIQPSFISVTGDQAVGVRVRVETQIRYRPQTPDQPATG